MYLTQNEIDAEERTRKKYGEEVYFEGNKKNQLNDLKKLFKSIVHDPQKAFTRKQLIKRIINDTTKGIDTSRFFPEMVLASGTKDLVQKKMIYFYLINFSKNNQNFARMAINTFLKDSTSPNPNIRALSLRHLSNLRFKDRDEYILPLLKQGLNDFSSLVKKSSIMGLTKIIIEKNRKVEEPEREEEILNELYSLIRDADAGVVCCALEAINQIQPEGLVMNKKLANYLLDNLANFDEYQLPIILRYYQLYDPKSQEQAVNTMNVLYAKIRSSILSLTLSICKIYLNYASLFPQHLPTILDRLKRPLLSFLNNDSPQVQYIALKHIQYIIKKYQSTIFQQDIKKFFLLSNEPTYIKLVKIKIIQLNIKQENFIDLINQLSQYISEQQISKQTINSLERIMMKEKNEQNSKFIIKTIIKVIEQTWNDYLCNNALPAIRNFLRKYPKEFELFQNIFYTLVNKTSEDQARCALIEIIGDYGEHIEDAIELVAWSQKQCCDSVRISLMRANVKLFLKRPLEMLNLIMAMFNEIFRNDSIQLYVRDYAAFLYRGLQKDIEGFKKIFLQTRKRQDIVEVQSASYEINTLEVVYQEQQYKWIIAKDKFLDELAELEYEDIVQQQTIDTDKQQESGQNNQRLECEKIKLNINFDSHYRALQADDFDNEFQIEAEEFEEKWSEYEVGSSITRIISNIEMVSEENLEELFKIWNVGVMASAEDDETIKLYLYCKIKHNEKAEIALLEFQVVKLSETMTLMIKSEDEQLAGYVSKYVEEFLKLNEII